MFDRVKVYVVEFGNRPNFQLQWRDPITQRLRTKATNVPRDGARSKKAAERLAGELEAQLMAGAGGIPSRLSWQEFRGRYEAEVVPGLAKRTAEKVKTVFDRLEEDLSPIRLWDLTEARLSHFAAGLRKAGLSESTLAGYLAHLKSALGWAVRQKLMPMRPAFPKIQRAKKYNRRPMKGRPITLEEFERMLAAVPAVVGQEAAPEWCRYLRGLWASGLRLAESMDLWWDRPDRLYPVFPKGGRPMLHVPGELEKGNSDRLLPIAPEFALFLAETPEAERTGPVFPLTGRRRGQSGRPLPHRVSEIVSEIGEKAGVKVYVDPKDPERVKYASAHDLRRAFGERWAARVMPPMLMELMRHESIETTLRYYVGTDAQRTADAAWDAFERANLGAAPNKSSNTAIPGRPAGGGPAADTRVFPGDGASLKVDGAGIEPATHGFSVQRKGEKRSG
jgi:integrase